VSLHVTSWVLKHSEARLGERLVLIVLSDYAHDDGGEAYPSVETIAREARLSERQVQRCLRDLEADDMIRNTGISRHGTTIWQVVMGRQIVTPRQNDGVTNTTEIVSEMSPNPSVNPPSRTSDEVLRVSQALETHVKEVTGRDKKLTQTDHTTIDRMLRIDGVPADEVVRMLVWLDNAKPGDDAFEVADFWRANILSAKKLREKFPQIRAQASRRTAKGRAGMRRDGMTDAEHREAVLEGARRIDELGR
jgi:hypothetical protein